MSEDDSDQQIMDILNSIFSSIDGKLLPIIKISEKLSSIIEYLNKETNRIDTIYTQKRIYISVYPFSNTIHLRRKS